MAVEIKASDVRDLMKASYTFSYNPAVLEFVSISDGGFVKDGGDAPLFKATPDPASGSIGIYATTGEGAQAVSGAGLMATAIFKAKAKGPAFFEFKNTSFLSNGDRPMDVLPFRSAIDVR